MIEDDPTADADERGYGRADAGGSDGSLIGSICLQYAKAVVVLGGMP